jgi:hypothetical protein
MSDAMDANLPPRWDRNFSNTEFEIVSEDDSPVLQVTYRRGDVIQVNGIFLVRSNLVFSTFNDLSSFIDISSWAVKEPIDAISVSGNAIDTVSGPRRSIFKYPSSRYAGVYAR